MEKFFEQRKETLNLFLKGQKLHGLISAAPVDEEERDLHTAYDDKVSPPAPYDTELAPGQIRVLPNMQRITYVALIKRWEEDSFLVMPFSNFSVPATEYEFLTEYNGGVWQRVLQVWNARTLQDETLQKSWVSDTLPAQDLEDAWHLWEKSLGGKEVEDRLLLKTCLPIYHLEDPRLDYKRKELENFARIDREDLQLLEQPAYMRSNFADRILEALKKERPSKSLCDCLLDGKTFFQTHAMAAGTSQEALQFDYHFDDQTDDAYQGIELFAEYSPHDHRMDFFVNDTTNGEPTDRLDEYVIYDLGQKKPLGCIANGTLQINYDFTEESMLLLLDSDGEPVHGSFKIHA